MRVETFATTNEGRALPLVIVGPPGVVDPRSAKSSGLPVVFIMANIHAGEVEGKEAAQMLLRDLVSSHRALRGKLIVLPGIGHMLHHAAAGSVTGAIDEIASGQFSRPAN